MLCYDGFVSTQISFALWKKADINDSRQFRNKFVSITALKLLNILIYLSKPRQQFNTGKIQSIISKFSLMLNKNIIEITN